MRNHVSLRTVLLCAVAAVPLAMPTAASAQQAIDDAVVPSAEEDSNSIIVTAQRRAERLEDVPASITALNAETLENAGIVSVQDLGRVTPGLQIGFGGAFTAPSIRGITTITNGNNIENNVAIYIDGFYQPNSVAINADLPNIANVQVLKGPQGTLYGRNATGGAVLINTLDPGRDWSGRAELTYARFQDMRVSAFVSGPISDNIGFSLAGYHRRSESYIKLADPAVVGGTLDKGAAPISQDALRAKLKFGLGDDFTATLGYSYTMSDDTRGLLFSVFENVLPSAPPPPARPIRPGTAAYNYKQKLPVEQHQGTLKLELGTGLGTLTSYSGYARTENTSWFDFDGTYVDSVFSKSTVAQDTYQQAVDLVVDEIDRLNLVVGGLYYHDTIRNDPAGNQSFGPNLLLQRADVWKSTTKAWAIYADATFEVTDRLSVELGGRYSDETKDVNYTGLNYTPAGVATVAAGFPVYRKTSSNRFTPRASIRFEVADRTNVYATYSRGFRSGQFSLSRPANPATYAAVLPEDVNAYEIGFKTAQDIFRFNVAAYYYDYKNLQVNVAVRGAQCDPNPNVPCGVLNTLFSNAPKAEVYGGEAELEVRPIENLMLRAGAAYTHARYTDFPSAIGTGINGTDPILSPNVSQNQNWSGQQLARAPDWTANAGIEYTYPIGDGGILFAGNVNYSGSYVVSNPSLFGPLAGPLANVQRFRTGPYTLVNASLTYTEPTGHAYVGVFGRNLTNKRYRSTYNGTGSGTYFALSEPMTWGVRVGFKY